MKRISFFTALFATGAAALVAQDAPKSDDLFKQLDKNNDGKLVRSEVPEDQVRHFERLLRVGDADKNGELSKAEFDKATSDAQDEPRRPEAGPGGPNGGRPGFMDPKQAFERMDQNKDGKLSRSELPEFLRDRMGKIFDDLKKDEITLDEFTKGREKLGPPPDGGARPGAGGSPAEMFKRMDANNDGKVTLEEIPERARQFLGPIFERLGKKEMTQDEFVRAAERFRPDGERRPEGAGRPEGDRRPEGERRPEAGRPDGERRPEGNGPRPEGGFRGPRFFQLLDKDRNGRVSKEELTKAAALIDELDENKDGELDPRELLGPPPGGPGAGPDGRGPMPEGRGPMPEIRPGAPEGRRPDAPREGERRPENRPEGERRREGDQPRDNAPRGAGERPQAGAAPRFDADFFKRLDKDGDGKISRSEAPERLSNNFDRIDTNKDGVIDAEEFRKMAEQVGERRRSN